MYTARQCLALGMLSVGLLLSGAVMGREPFVEPAPPLSAYRFAEALDQVKLHGLVVTRNTSRAVLFIESFGRYIIVQPGDGFEVVHRDLRHQFRVGRMGNRRILLQGSDEQWYEIGVEARG